METIALERMDYNCRLHYVLEISKGKMDLLAVASNTWDNSQALETFKGTEDVRNFTFGAVEWQPLNIDGRTRYVLAFVLF